MATPNITTETKPKRRGRPRGKMDPEALRAQRVSKVRHMASSALYAATPDVIDYEVQKCGPIGRSLKLAEAWRDYESACRFTKRYLPDDDTAAAVLSCTAYTLNSVGVNDATICFHRAAETVHYYQDNCRRNFGREDQAGGERA